MTKRYAKVAKGAAQAILLLSFYAACFAIFAFCVRSCGDFQ